MKLLKLRKKELKQLIHVSIPFILSTFLTLKGMSGFKASLFGAVYALFTLYVYLYIKKEEPPIVIMGVIFYLISISGWGDF